MRISTQEFRQRVDRCSRLMEREGHDVLLAYASRIQYGTVRYLTGYEPWLAPEEWAFAVLAPGHGAELSLLSNSPWDFWDFNRAESTWVGDVVVGSRWVDEIAARMPPGARRVGIAGWYGFPAPVLEGLKERLPGAQLSDATPLLRELRAVKSEAEVALLREVGYLSDLAGAAFFEAAQAGATEREVAAHIDATLVRRGTQQTGYFTILGSGPRTVASCFLPGDRALRQGEVVQLDCGPMVDGYKGDFSRVVLAGTERPEAAVRLLETVAEAHEVCAALLKPGVPCSAIARAGLGVIEARGYTRANLFKSANYPDMVFMGHGIGLENPDPPGMLTLTNDTPLEAGMVINLEPILLDPDVGGARIETAFLVSAAPGGPIPLSACKLRPWRSA